METSRRLYSSEQIIASGRNSRFSPLRQEEFVKSTSFRYISDAITKEEALTMLKEKEAAKGAREEKVRELG